MNLDYAILLPPENGLFALFLNIKPFFTMKKEKQHSKWLTPVERYDRDNLFSLFFGCQHNLFFCARLFSTQWPLYDAHILQGLLCDQKIENRELLTFFEYFDVTWRNLTFERASSRNGTISISHFRFYFIEAFSDISLRHGNQTLKKRTLN